MRTISGTLATALASGSIMQRVLFWVTARDRSTGSPVTLGFWNGDDNQDFVISSVTRTYYGAGDLSNPDRPIVYQTGVKPTDFELNLVPISPEVADAIRLYDCRMSSIEIHRAFFDPLTGNLIEEPTRVFKGQIEEAPLIVPEVNGNSTVTLRLVSSAVNLTRSIVMTQSDTYQQLRSSDRFRRYVDISGSIDVAWGTK